MGIKIVATVELEYEVEDDESPLHPLNLAKDHLLAAFIAARRWSTSDYQALEYLAGLIDLQLREARALMPAGRVYPKKEKIPRRIAKAVFERDGYRCVHCGTWLDLTVDHITPESKGGALDMDNLQTLCGSCNSRKGAR
jgi:hypothetical protein